MADKSFWDNVSGWDVAEVLGMLNPITAGVTSFLSPSEANAGETEWVDAMNAVPGFLELSTEDQNRVIAERQSTRNPVNITPPEVSPRKLHARQRIVPQSTRNLVDKPGTTIRSPRAARRVTPSGMAGGPPQRTATQTSPSMGLEFGDVKGLSPTNVQTTAARREAAALRNRIVEEDARKRRAAEIARLREEQRKKDIAEFPRLQKSLTRKAPIKPKQKPTLRDVGDTSITRGKSMAALRDVAAKKKVREKAAEAKKKPKVVKTEKKITKVKPKVVKKVAKEKKPTPIKEALGTGRKAHTVKSGQTLSGIAKQHGTTLKALLAANPKLKGRPNLIKVGEKIKIRGPLKKAASPYKGMTKKEWEKVTTASKKQREQRSARKTGGIVKKAGGGKMKQVGLHTAEMRSGGKDLHQPQSKIKKRIHEETTYAKKGGQVGKKKKKKVGKKEQGYKARKDESIAMRVKKKRTKKQLKASRNESYGKWGKGKGKGKINRFGDSLVASTYD